MSPRQDNDRLYCWEQVQRVNPLFRVSQPFAPSHQSDGLLALYALFSAVEELCTECSDVEVARRKLDWWRVECLVTGIADSRHPILKELSRAGVAPEREILTQLFDGAGARLDGEPPADGSALEGLCQDTGSPQCALELGYAEHSAPDAAPGHLARRIGLAQLLRESSGQGRPNRFWWLPLNLLARHGIGRAELERSPDAATARALFAEVLQLQSGWDHSTPLLPSSARHLVVQERVQGCALARLQKYSPSKFPGVLRKADAVMLFQAWKAARRVSRP